LSLLKFLSSKLWQGKQETDNATPTIQPWLLAPKQAGRHRLNKINRHLSATSVAVAVVRAENQKKKYKKKEKHKIA